LGNLLLRQNFRQLALRRSHLSLRRVPGLPPLLDFQAKDILGTIEEGFEVFWQIIEAHHTTPLRLR
jgi:hypothetical protein